MTASSFVIDTELEYAILMRVPAWRTLGSQRGAEEIKRHYNDRLSRQQLEYIDNLITAYKDNKVTRPLVEDVPVVQLHTRR